MLPPVSTTGLVSADVGALTERVRDQMLEVLLDLSNEPAPSKTAEPKETTFPVPLPLQTPVQTTPEIKVDSATEVIVPPKASPSIPSHVVAPSESSENGTDDDDMVIVGRPAAK